VFERCRQILNPGSSWLPVVRFALDRHLPIDKLITVASTHTTPSHPLHRQRVVVASVLEIAA
jgi:hypothetical protein